MRGSLKVYRFAPFELNLSRYELTRDERPVAMPRVPMEILILLLERGDRLLTRAEIAAAIWPQSDPEDVVQNINVAVNRIRTTLGDNSADPTYIFTVIGKGYRFIAPVEATGPIPDPAPHRIADQIPYQIPDHPGAVAAESAAENSHTVQRASPQPVLEPAPPADVPLMPAGRMPQARPGWLPALSAALACLLLAAAFLFWRSRRTEPHDEAAPDYGYAQLTTFDDSKRVTAGGVDPSGHRVAYANVDGVALEDTGTGHNRHTIATPSLREITHIAWFPRGQGDGQPDGERLILSGFGRENNRPEVWLLLSRDGSLRLLAGNAQLGVPSPDGSQVAIVSGDGREVWVGGPDGQNPRRVLQGAPGDTFPVLLWSAAGNTLLLERRSVPVESGPATPPAGAQASIRRTYLAIEAVTGKVLTSIDGLQFTSACLLHSGQLVYAVGLPDERSHSTLLYQVPVDPHSGAFLGTPRLLREFHDLRVNELTATGDTFSAILRLGFLSVFTANVTPGMPRRLENVQRQTGEDNHVSYVHSWTADSSALLLETKHQGRFTIFRQSPQGKAEPLSSMEGIQVFARMPAGGRWILFANRPFNHVGPYQLYRLPAGGGDAVPLQTGGTSADYRCALANSLCLLRDTIAKGDGQELVYYRLDPVAGRGAPVWSMPLTGTGLGDWDLSPDGRTVVLALPTNLSPSLRLVTLAQGGGAAEVTDLPLPVGGRIVDVNWDAEGRGWYVSVPTPAGSDLFHVTREGQASLLRQTDSETWAVPSSDGRRIGFMDRVVDSNVWLATTR